MQADSEASMELDEWLTYQALTGLRQRESLEPQQAYLVASDLARAAYRTRVGHAPEPAGQWNIVYRTTIAATHRYLLARSNSVGLLYTFGYTMPCAEAIIEQLVALGVLITDIRYFANSRVAKWRKARLQEQLGEHYLHLRALGNVNYNRPGGIQLYQREIGVDLAGERLRQGQHLAFMCVCRELEGCHREVAAQRMLEQFPALRVVHL